MASSNGGIIGKTNAPTSATASGVWSLSAAMLAIKDSNWPLNDAALRLDFSSTTTLDSRITFTRATSATYFDSAGTLQTASSGVARFDHRLESGVWVNKGLLIEEQRTNACLRSEEFGTTWATTNATVTANAIAAPDGTTTADTITDNATNGGHNVSQTITGTAPSQTLTASVYVKNNNVGWVRLSIFNSGSTGNQVRAWFNLTNGTVGTVDNVGTGTGATASIENVGNGWYRCVLSGKPDTAGSNAAFTIFTQTANGQAGYVGTGQSLYAWGAQLEAGAFPTSYIKTTSASVTRNADVASMTSTNFSSWYNATEGTVFWQGDLIGLGKAVLGTAAPRAWSINNSTSNERIFLNAEVQPSAGAATTTGNFLVVDGGATQATLNGEATPSNAIANFTYKYATVYKANDFAASVNGNSTQTDTSGTLPTVNRLQLGAEESANTLVLCGHIAKFYYWNTRKTDAFLQSITG